jgi:TolB-like protein
VNLQVAKHLNVANILDGSVPKAGNKVRVTAQLVRASDSARLWSETDERTLDDMLRVQPAVASRGYVLVRSLF